MENKNNIERIVQAYSDLLLRLVIHDTKSRSAAEDIVQETFLRYLKKAPDFQDEEHEKAWLIRVSSNLSKDYHRSWWHRKSVPLEEQITCSVEQENDTYQLLPYIKQLPMHSRHAIFLFYYEGYSIRTIAEIYKVKENTVASWLHRGRKCLKKMMEGVNIDDLG